MSLARLLTAAKALTRFNESPTAYRVRRAALLPKFGAASDPFASEKKADAATVPAQLAAAPVVGGSARRTFWPWRLRSGKQEVSDDAKPALLPRAGPTRAARTPVQGELTLDNVRVVRNDLRDADVDIVARTGGTQPGRPAVATNLMLGALAAEKALDRLADRIVGAEVS